MDDLELISILESHIDMKKNGRNYNFKCPYCETDPKYLKRSYGRGNIYRNNSRNSYAFKCFNCGKHSHLKELAKFVIPGYSDLSLDFEFKKKDEDVIIEVFKSSHSVLDIIRSNYKSIDQLEDDHKAKEYLINRKIMSSLLNDIFYTENAHELMMRFDFYKEDSTKKERSGFKTEAICFPFYLEDGSYDYIQFRFFDGPIRYITYCINPGSRNQKIWGIKYLNLKTKIYIAEGTIDSMMFSNTLSCGGHGSLISSANFLIKNFNVKKDDIILIYDRDYVTNKDVRKQLTKAIDSGFNVFIYGNELNKINDLNDIVMYDIMTSSKLKSYIYLNTFNGLKAKLIINNLKSVI